MHKLLLSAALFFFSHSVFASASSTVLIEPRSEATVDKAAYMHSFKLLDSKSGKYLGESDLAIFHEKKVHFIVYDLALKEFQHVHPTFDGTYWNVDLSFLVSGDYLTWAQGKINKGAEFSTSKPLTVQVQNPAWPQTQLSDVREGADGLSKIVLGRTKLRAGQMAMLDLSFLRTDGSTAELTPYLGAIAHVIAVTADGQELIHVHPMEGGSENEAMLHTTFPEAGLYRIWIEFIDDGILKRVPLAVEVF